MLDARSPVSFADGVLDPGVTQELVDWLQHMQYRYYRITNKNEPEPFPIWHRELLGRDWPINQASDYSCTPHGYFPLRTQTRDTLAIEFHSVAEPEAGHA